MLAVTLASRGDRSFVHRLVQDGDLRSSAPEAPLDVGSVAGPEAFGAQAGVVTGLIGPNGAGEDDALRRGSPASNRCRRPASSRSTGVTSARLAPYKRARRGLARTFHASSCSRSSRSRKTSASAADIHRGHTRNRSIDPDQVATEILERIGFVTTCRCQTWVSSRRAGPPGRGRSCSGEPRPSVLLLDEPASGQTSDETQTFARLLADLASDGIAVVLVEHDVALVMQACEHIHVLDFGRIIASGSPDEIKSDAAVLTAYLGTGPEEASIEKAPSRTTWPRPSRASVMR